MKRYTHFRMSGNTMCMIPRKAVTWIMLSMVVMTILSFILIEVRRIIVLRNLPRKRHHSSHQKAEVGASNLSHSDELHTLNNAIPHKRVPDILQTKISWNYEAVEALLGDHPQCPEKPYLLILVASAPENFDQRDAIRKTWADMEKWTLQLSGLKYKTIFLVGKSSTKFLNILLENENIISEDILIGDYLDTYRNLTRKVMHGFSWALHHCQPTFLLKTDDDCFVNVPQLLQFLFRFNPVPINLYAGRIRWSAPVVRDPNSRWFVSTLEYPKHRYAPYANGAGYILSQDVLKKLVVFSDRVRIFPNEDAYVGTVLQAAGIRPTYSARFVTHSGPWQVCNFLYLFVIHRVKATRQSEHQDLANKATVLCSTENIIKDWV